MVVYVIDFSTASASPLNPLGSALRSYIWEQLRSAAANSAVTSIVLTGGGPNFSAGADLTEFSSASALSSISSGSSGAGPFVPSLIDVVNAIEGCAKPVVACIQGACLGGGLEVALACHYRVAHADAHSTQLGLPEVHVGVIPGAGGTQRLPRLIGLQPALQMILTGAPVSGSKAVKLKLVDAVTDKDLLETAVKWAAWAEVMPLTDRRASLRTVLEPPATAHVLCHIASLSIPVNGGEGVRAALEACRASYTLPFERGMQREGELFLQMLQSAEGKARRHAFFAVRSAQKMAHPPADKRHVLLQEDVSSVQTAVIGAGTMGGGIALVLLQTGFSVVLVDISKPALDKGVAMVHSLVESYVKRKKLTEEVAKNMLLRMTATQNLRDLSNCQLVVEAVIEKMEIKQNIFRTLNAVTGPNCLILSNTSTLDIDTMATVLDASRRPLFAGWHFFSPAHVMKLVEIVVGAATSAETTALLQSLTKRIGKTGVVVGNCDGFCGNRLLRPYSAETVMLLVEDGALIEQVDAALLNFGMALGPFQLSDLAGNDIGYNIRRERGWVREDSDSALVPSKRPARYTELADDMVSQLGRLGQKVGKGWYDYNPNIGKGRKALASTEMANFVVRYVKFAGSQKRSITQNYIIERVLYPLVNEGFKCLEEGIARSAGDIDVVYLYGYGWPVWRGGPMYWADHQVGLPVLLDKLQEFHRRFPETDYYEPSKLLVECVALGLTVEDYYRGGQEESKRSKL